MPSELLNDARRTLNSYQGPRCGGLERWATFWRARRKAARADEPPVEVDDIAA